jgi:hypothetical protein
MKCHNPKPPLNVTLPDRCCVGTTGCEFDGSLRNVKAEPIYVQKVFDAALFNLQAMRSVQNVQFRPALGPNVQILRINEIRCRKFFNPANINDPANLVVDPTTTITGADFVEDGCGRPITVIGPDGLPSQQIIYTDTSDCDQVGRGTPVFGTQRMEVSGNVVVEIDLTYVDCKKCEIRTTVTANVNIANPEDPIVLTNFFELCIPSVFDTAFLPRFTEFCNIDCQVRLASNHLRDIIVCPVTGRITANLLIALCISCEKKVIVPVQLCVLSTGYPVLAADVAPPVCPTFPPLFPKQIDRQSIRCAEEAGTTE